MTEPELPDPECQMGYTRQQVIDIVGEDIEAFAYWMRGQTMSICEGRLYNHETREYEPSGCGPHGVITYVGDLKRYLYGGRWRAIPFD